MKQKLEGQCPSSFKTEGALAPAALPLPASRASVQVCCGAIGLITRSHNSRATVLIVLTTNVNKHAVISMTFKTLFNCKRCKMLTS